MDTMGELDLGSHENSKIAPELRFDTIGLTRPEVVTTPEGFKINGVNETSFIKSLKTLNGVPVSHLENVMRPDKDPEYSAQLARGEKPTRRISFNGFIGEEDSLIDVLAEDNDTVLGMGLTHQDLADFLGYFPEAYQYLWDKGKSSNTFEYKGRRYQYWRKVWPGWQNSPFEDGTRTSHDHTLISLDDGSSLNYSGLIPTMVGRYGFYEGNVAYRIPPQAIADLAGIRAKPDNDPILVLLKDKTAKVTLETTAQARRIRNLQSCGINILESASPEVIEQYRKLDKQLVEEELAQSIAESEEDKALLRRVFSEAQKAHADIERSDSFSRLPAPSARLSTDRTRRRAPQNPSPSFGKLKTFISPPLDDPKDDSSS